MQVTLANIQREYETPSAIWVRVIGYGATVAVAAEIFRRVAGEWATAPAWASAVIAALAGWGLTHLLARAVRRASLAAELWRKFGLAPELLAACRDLPPLSPALTAEVDRALLAVRSLAAVGNHDPLPADADAPQPEAVVERAEAALAETLGRPPADLANQLPLLAEALAQAAEALRSVLATGRAGDIEAHAAAMECWRTASRRWR